jgi:hypothetical protein
MEDTMFRIGFIAAALLTLASFPTTSAFAKDTVAVIGTGRVGSALGPHLAQVGYTVVYGSRDPSAQKVVDLVAKTGNGATAKSQADAAKDASIVILAVPWAAVEPTVKAMGDLDGKIVIDVTNPLSFAGGTMTVAVTDGSGAELVQSWAPGAKVVKAFNAMSSRVMADPAIAGGPVTVPMVGDDKDAKAKVAALIADLGLESADLGPLANARYVEGMTVLYMVPLLDKRPGDMFEFYLRKAPAKAP